MTTEARASHCTVFFHRCRGFLREAFSRGFAIDLRSLAAFRILFAFTLLCDLFWRAQDLRFFYSEDGVLTRAEALSFGSGWYWSLYYLNADWKFAALLLFLTGCACVMLLVGRWTRLMSILVWLLMMSLHRRNPQVLQGGDTLIRCLAFWTMFLPLGARWSWDAKAVPEKQDDDTLVCSAAGACLLLQVASVYVFSALLKSDPIWQVDHTAIYYALNVDQLATPFGHSLIFYPELLRWLTFAVVWLERIGPILPFVPFRNGFFRILAAGLFIGFHFGLTVTMELGPFPYICMAAWVIFLPPEFWRTLLKGRSPGVEPAGFREPLSNNGRALRAAVLSFYFAVVTIWNVRTLDFTRYVKVFPRELNGLLELIGLDQEWSMFAPYPLNWDGWYQIPAATRSGRIVNLTPGMNPNDPLTDARPVRIEKMYRNERWRKYLMSLADVANISWRPGYARALASRWAEDHPDDPIINMDINYFLERTSLEGTSPPRKLRLWHYEIGTGGTQPVSPGGGSGAGATAAVSTGGSSGAHNPPSPHPAEEPVKVIENPSVR